MLAFSWKTRKNKKCHFTETTVSDGKGFEGKFLSRCRRTLQELPNALPCLLTPNGLSLLPSEILFEEFYNKAIKNHFGIKWKCKASSCLFGIWVVVFLKSAF